MKKTNPQKKLTNAQQKIIDKLIKSQEVVKRYLMFNGAESQTHWIPPLDYSEVHTNSAAQARVLRLAKLLNFREIFYIANKGKEPDLFVRKLNKFDEYVISNTSIGLNRSEIGIYTQNESLPLVVPMIYTMKKYKWEDLNHQTMMPSIMVTKTDGTMDKIICTSEIRSRMLDVLQYIGSFKVPFTDDFLDYILYGTELGIINADTKLLVNSELPYLNEYFRNTPEVVESEK